MTYTEENMSGYREYGVFFINADNICHLKHIQSALHNMQMQLYLYTSFMV